MAWVRLALLTLRGSIDESWVERQAMEIKRVEEKPG
jgi:hypothetical protein